MRPKEVKGDGGDLLLRPDGSARGQEARHRRRRTGEALECPRCGHLDHLSWLQEPEGVFEEARRRSGERRVFAA